MMHTRNNLVVLGAGESGVGAAILGRERGWQVFLSDAGRPRDKYADMLRQEGIECEFGGHTMERLLQADLCVKSPGIPGDAPAVAAMRERGIEVISEIEFAGRYTDARMVCITGSNGKTTTTELTYHILRAAGIDVGLAGNVGRSLALQVARDPHDVYVIELSSFQLDDMYRFKANVAVLLNITPDHLDRYDNRFENYVAAKFRILQNQTPQDAFIYWHDDPVIADQLRQLRVEARRMPFATERYADSAAWVDDEKNIVFDTNEESFTMPLSQLALAGVHNLYNSMAAGLSAALLNVRNDVIRHALASFEGVEHRLEYILTDSRGVKWINDSKATNINSCYYALEAMPEGESPRVVLILGGKDKGNDYSEILEPVRRKVKAIVAMGAHNEKIINYFKDVVPVSDTHSVQECVDECRRLATEGDTVLLSPCCASFDLFSSYEERGKLFKAYVGEVSNND